MKNKKRIIPAILASVILVSFSGCKIADTTDKIANGVTDAYYSVENFFTGAYQSVEDFFVNAYVAVEDKCVELFFAKEGETVEEAKDRLKGNNK